MSRYKTMAAGLFAVFIGLAVSAHAATVTLTTTDSIGQTSYNTGLHWSDSSAPSAGNDYVVPIEWLRTPTTSSGSYTFAGDSLTITNGGGFIIKSDNSTHTIDDFILADGGKIWGGNSTGNDGTVFNGHITSSGTGGFIYANQSSYIINSDISGDGDLTLAGSYALTFHGTIDMAADFLVTEGTKTLDSDSIFVFTIGANGVNNVIVKSGGTLNCNGMFDFDLSGADTTLGNTWTVSTGAGFGSTFSVTNSGGAPVTDNGDGSWYIDDSAGSGGEFKFYEDTGILESVSGNVIEMTAQNQVPASGGIVTTNMPTISVELINGTYALDTNSIVMTLNGGSSVAPTVLPYGSGTNLVSYTPALALENDLYTVSLVWQDLGALSYTNTWSFSLTDVYLTDSDGLGSSSFNTAGYWSNGEAPTNGLDYLVGGTTRRLRTPADTNSYTFAGDSLTLANNASAYGLTFKGGIGGAITVSNLIMQTGGFVSQLAGTQDFHLYGAITVAGDSTFDTQEGPIVVHSDISGSATITIEQGNQSVSALTLMSQNNTFTGSIVANDAFTLAEGCVLNFVIGTNGVNNSVSGLGPATFNGLLVLDLSGASTIVDDSWSLCPAGATYGESFAISNATGAAIIDNGDGTWYLDDTAGSGGKFKFFEETGLLQAVNDNIVPMSSGNMDPADGARLTEVNYISVELYDATYVLSGTPTMTLNGGSDLGPMVIPVSAGTNGLYYFAPSPLAAGEYAVEVIWQDTHAASYTNSWSFEVHASTTNSLWNINIAGATDGTTANVTDGVFTMLPAAGDNIWNNITGVADSLNSYIITDASDENPIGLILDVADGTFGYWDATGDGVNQEMFQSTIGTQNTDLTATLTNLNTTSSYDIYMYTTWRWPGSPTDVDFTLIDGFAATTSATADQDRSPVRGDAADDYSGCEEGHNYVLFTNVTPSIAGEIVFDIYGYDGSLSGMQILERPGEGALPGLVVAATSPTGVAEGVSPSVSAQIVNVGTTVDTNATRIVLDGSTNSVAFAGTNEIGFTNVVSVQTFDLGPGSHDVSLIYVAAGGDTNTVEWSFTVAPYITWVSGTPSGTGATNAPTIQAVIANGSGTLNTGTAQLLLDDVILDASISVGVTNTLSCQTNLADGVQYKVSAVYEANEGGGLTTNTWYFTTAVPGGEYVPVTYEVVDTFEAYAASARFTNGVSTAGAWLYSDGTLVPVGANTGLVGMNSNADYYAYSDTYVVLGWGYETGVRTVGHALSVSNSVDNYSTGKYFFRLKSEDASPNCGAGLCDVNVSNAVDVADYEVQVQLTTGLGGTMNLTARDGGSFVSILPGIPADTWVNVELDVDNTTDTYDVYVSYGSDAPVLKASGLAFRNGTTSALTTFMAWTQGVDDKSFGLDDVYASVTQGEPTESPVLSASVSGGSSFSLSWEGGGTYSVLTNADLVNGSWGVATNGTSPISIEIGSDPELFYMLSE